MKNKIILLFFAIILLAFVSCSDKKNDTMLEQEGGYGTIAIVNSLPNPDGMSGGYYLKLIEDLQTPNQEINNYNAYPISYGGSHPHINGNEMYVFPSYMGGSKQELVKYVYANKSLRKKDVMVLPANSGANCIIVQSSEKAYMSLAGLGKIMIFNPATMEKLGEIDLTYLGISDKNPDPSMMILRDSLLFVGLNQMVGGWTPPSDYKKSDVAIINTKADTLLKVISETTSNMSMPARPIDPNTIFMDENKDIYIVCIGAFGMIPGHNSGILRIKNGESDFDPNYKWVITGAPIEDEEETPSFVSSIKYADNGKAYAYVNIPGYWKDGDKSHNAIADLAVEIDLYNKKMKKIKGLDLSNGFGILISTYKDNQMVIGNSSAKSKGIYLLNTLTGEVSKEPIFKPIGNPSMFYYFGK